MAKQRNSLGICVLTLPNEETLTWEQYKEKFGIDLEKIFTIYEDTGTYYVQIRKDFRKMIVLSYFGPYDTTVPPVSTPTQYYQNGSSTLAESILGLNVLYGDGDGGYVLTIFANKTISGGTV